MTISVWAYGIGLSGVDGSAGAGGRKAAWLTTRAMGIGSSAQTREPIISKAIKTRAMSLGITQPPSPEKQKPAEQDEPIPRV